MADHKDPSSSSHAKKESDGNDDDRARLRRALQAYISRGTNTVTLNRIIAAELAELTRGTDNEEMMLSPDEQEALLKCRGRQGGEMMERLLVLGLIECGECVAPRGQLEFVSYNRPPTKRSPNVLYLSDITSLRVLAVHNRVPLKISTHGGRGSDVFYITLVDIVKRRVRFQLLESKFGKTQLDDGKRGRLANGDKSASSTNRVMREILRSLRQTATAIRDALVAALHLDSDDEAACSFDLVLACGSPINGPAYERLTSERREHSVELWHHDHLWDHVWEERVKSFLLAHYNDDEARARLLHSEYDVAKHNKSKVTRLVAAAYARQEEGPDLDEDEDEDEDDDSSNDDDENTTTSDNS